MQKMSSEIVPFVDGSDTPSADPHHDDTWKGKAAVVQHLSDSEAIVLGSIAEDVRPFDLLGLRSVESSTVKVNLFGENHDIRHFLPLENGPQCVTQLNPTLETLKLLLQKMKEPSLLHLRGCDQLFSTNSPFPFEKFKTLTSLEISSVTNLTTLPAAGKTISEMTQLQALNLSHLPIQQLPIGFFSNLQKLRSLTLKDCPNIHPLPKLAHLTALEYLELSHLLIETLPDGIFSNSEKIYRVVLKGCSKLSSLPSMESLKRLRVLDLSHCTHLKKLISSLPVPPIKSDDLWKLDLSYIALDFKSSLGKIPCLTHLFLRDAKGIDFEIFTIPLLKVLDISGAQSVKGLDLLMNSKDLEALDLSRTKIESIDFISNLEKLRYLILKECTRLQKLPAVENLTQLEVLDISGCESLGDLPEDISSLKMLKDLNLSGCCGLQELSPGLSHFISHDLAAGPSGSGEIDFINNDRCRIEGRLSKPNEFYIVSTYFSYSFDQFRQCLDLMVLLFERNLQISGNDIQPASSLDTNPILPISPSMIDVAPCHSRRKIADLKYVRDNIGLLESCHNCNSAEELLATLTRVINPKNDLSKIDFETVANLKLSEIDFRTVAKLKLLVPPKRVDVLEKEEEEKKRKKKKKEKTRRTHEQRDVNVIDINTPEIQNLSRSYDCLTDIQKKCLLYLTVFPNKSIKERILVNLWHGEGFLDPQNKENVALTNPNPESTSMSKETGPTRDDADTIETMGRQILMVLRKDFIERPFRVRIWKLKPCAISFVRERAMEEHFFNVDHKTRKLTPSFIGSKRACLLRSQGKLKSSCKHWSNDMNSCKHLEESLKTTHALLNVNESMVDIKAEWFSKMTNLHVLHLGGLYFKEDEATNILEWKFLKELKNMKRLRLLSLEGLSAIKKLPESVCKLVNLKILNLRDCSDLEKLPAGIGSLKNLTHLDLTNCRILWKLPKGIRLLSNLEVLKGFVVYYQIGGRPHQNACTLEELFKLEKLRKLNLVVHNDKFPDSSDLLAFNRMKNLCSLQITWEENYNDLYPAPAAQQDVVEQRKALRQYSCRWQQLKCWEPQERQDETEKLLRSNLIKKLELRCFPCENAPEWLHPSGLQKLEKLYVRGGKLTTLIGDTSEKTWKWNVKTLLLLYLPNMSMGWEKLRCNFPQMTYLSAYKSNRLSSFPFVKGSVWHIQSQENDRHLSNTS